MLYCNIRSNAYTFPVLYGQYSTLLPFDPPTQNPIKLLVSMGVEQTCRAPEKNWKKIIHYTKVVISFGVVLVLMAKTAPTQTN